MLLIATKNAHKTGEIRAMLGADWTVTDLTAHPEIPAPEETGDTFQANAEIKALAASALFPGLVLADDSGLEVDALGGAPGVRSARYAGEDANDADNRAKLLAELAKKNDSASPAPDCSLLTAHCSLSPARFRCAMALAENGRVLATFSGAVEGTIIDRERGEGGFGYDSLFIPEGEAKTFGELPAATKNRLSHRARALAQVIEYLRRRA